ncbi:gp53 [Enterobacteria phage ES18]|uniref:gp53 n=1 Tax=Enterobacteria phage ES18 TaxID=101570 RepID=UPI00004C9839|nr:gp53 [Enterobacteria phage ES18]AAW70524.1 gp53 [Enterobacteria phage ES18]
MTKEIVTFKGFNKDLTCRDFQFAIGETFHHDGKVEACGSGFHACECPFDVFRYYPPAESRYAETISFGVTDHEERGDTKIASSSITIKAELTLPQFIQRGIEWIWSKIDKSLEQQIMTGDQSAATNTGNWSAATNTGNWSAATNTGDQSAATNTGNWSAATNTGNWSAATNTGDQSAATNTGYQSAATNTGNWSAATNTGYQSAATNTGYQSAAEVSGSQSVAASLGIEGKARASEGGAIVLCYRDEDGELIHIRASKVGENGIIPNTWYQLDKDGEFVKCE